MWGSRRGCESGASPSSLWRLAVVSLASPSRLGEVKCFRKNHFQTDDFSGCLFAVRDGIPGTDYLSSAFYFPSFSRWPDIEEKFSPINSRRRKMDQQWYIRGRRDDDGAARSCKMECKRKLWPPGRPGELRCSRRGQTADCGSCAPATRKHAPIQAHRELIAQNGRSISRRPLHCTLPPPQAVCTWCELPPPNGKRDGPRTGYISRHRDGRLAVASFV